MHLIKDKSLEKLENLKKEYLNITNEKNNYIINHDFLKASKLKELENELEDKINKLYLKNKKESRVIIRVLNPSFSFFLRQKIKKNIFFKNPKGR